MRTWSRQALWALGSVIVLAAFAARAAQPLEETLDKAGSYKLYVPDAKKDAKVPLVVWLHPAGAEANALIVKWWPELFEMGYALMLPKSKTPDSWTLDEDAAVLGYVDDAVKKHGIDAKKVVLLGFSAGGQMSFYMGMTHGERFAGIVTMSAVPIKSVRDLSTTLPPKGCKDSLAYFMILGEQEEQAVEIAKRAQLELLADGFSALVHVVKKGGHQFAESEKKNVLAWLGEVAAGKRPAEAETRDLAKEAPDRIKTYRDEQERQRKLREELTAVAVKLFDDIQGAMGKPYAQKWKPAGEADQGGKVAVSLPEGWKLGEVTRNGDSSALAMNPPGDAHVVAFLGRSVKKDGMQQHYQKWFETMNRDNGMLMGKNGTIKTDGHSWDLYTIFLVPIEKIDRSTSTIRDPLARRVLILAISPPLATNATEWRSLTIMCPDKESTANHIAEFARGILEKTEFSDTPVKKD